MNDFQSLIASDQTGVLAFLAENPLAFILLMIWVIAWKGLALWKAARLSHKWWFMLILVANTIGVLEIIYIYFIGRKYTVETEEGVEVEEVDEKEDVGADKKE
jgi:hypothetical protein